MATPNQTAAVWRTQRLEGRRSWLGSNLRRQEALAGYLAILPWFLGFLFFSLGPIIASFILMFMKWEVITPAEWTGLGNFQRLLRDPLVLVSLWNTLFYTILAVPLNLVAALCAALLLNVGVRNTNVYRALIYLPSQMPIVATAILWFFIFSPTYGLANGILNWFGIAPQRWLWDVNLVKPSLVIMAIWAFGNAMIIFLAGLQGIPETLYEAARIDGANSWRLFRHITLPMLSPTLFFNLIIGIIGSFQVFTNVFIMTNGGPGNASLMLVLYIYQNGFQNFRMGYASLLAWVLFLIVLLMTLVQFRVSRTWVYYEGEVR
ncbi:MAG: sugar ABC transporter permease [Chloroflexi bacterium]|nr:MAG: sugar ABC transporter permease [Chloroflexota bacterium]